jgi:hypothetical protein
MTSPTYIITIPPSIYMDVRRYIDTVFRSDMTFLIDFGYGGRFAICTKNEEEQLRLFDVLRPFNAGIAYTVDVATCYTELEDDVAYEMLE